MRKEYIKPTSTIYAISIEDCMDMGVNNSTDTNEDNQFSKGTGSEGGGSSMWEYMEDEE